ncbi:hypothetical protein KRM28CT15_27960 [Krasilnikovia sp. M28-CT-15]
MPARAPPTYAAGRLNLAAGALADPARITKDRLSLAVTNMFVTIAL